jgi:hypothetical protein
MVLLSRTLNDVDPYRKVALLLAAASAVIITINWGLFTMTFVFRRNHRPIPLLGGLSGTLAVFLLLPAGSRGGWWIPLLIDYGCLYHAFWLSQRVIRRS